MEPWPDDLLEATPRFSKTMRIIAIVVIVAMILLAIIPVIVRVRRSSPPPTTVPTVVASVGGLQPGTVSGAPGMIG